MKNNNRLNVFLSLAKPAYSVVILVVLVICLNSCNKKPDTQNSNSNNNSGSNQAPAISALAGYLPVTVNVDPNHLSYLISPTFEGLSVETSELTSGSSYLTVGNPVLIQLIKNLGPGLLRIGGNTSDVIYWTGKARTKTTTTDSLTTSDIDGLLNFSKAIGWPVLLGLNLGSSNAATSANEALYVNNVLQNNLYAFQTGNEPDLYSRPGGQRPSSYVYNDFKNEWLTYFASVRQKVPQASFVGPGASYDMTWVMPFADNEHTNIQMIDRHYYNTGPATDPSITYSTILAPSNLDSYLQQLETKALLYGIPFRISECNSVYSGGKKGVSDTFASALWALDLMWQVAKRGGQGVNFHSSASANYTPIAYSNGVSVPRPEYYAMLAFKYGTMNGYVIPTTLNTTTYNCQSYTAGGNNLYTITLINKEEAKNIAFTINLSKVGTSIKIIRLSAPGLASTTGITFANNTVAADGSFTAGNSEQFTINSNTFIVNVPAGSAALVTVQ